MVLPPPFCAHTAGSLCAPDIILAAALHKQCHDLGWFQLCLGLVHQKWTSAVKGYNPNLDTARWTSRPVAASWQFTGGMQACRNALVHKGQAAIETAQLHELQKQCIHDLFLAYSEDQYFVLPFHSSLFTQCSTIRLRETVVWSGLLV
jgi:hypothetical protein